MGDYYFPNNTDNGGIWKYHVLDSSSYTAHEAKYYPGTSNQDAYAHLKFYTPVGWGNG
ncbi:MAG: hypothetical protein HFE59_06240 [Clostridiales bacterium]|nr:hypothetical protein [Clostridiales bacterium]